MLPAVFFFLEPSLCSVAPGDLSCSLARSFRRARRRHSAFFVGVLTLANSPFSSSEIGFPLENIFKLVALYSHESNTPHPPGPFCFCFLPLAPRQSAEQVWGAVEACSLWPFFRSRWLPLSWSFFVGVWFCPALFPRDPVRAPKDHLKHGLSLFFSTRSDALPFALVVARLHSLSSVAPPHHLFCVIFEVTQNLTNPFPPSAVQPRPTFLEPRASLLWERTFR